MSSDVPFKIFTETNISQNAFRVYIQEKSEKMITHVLQQNNLIMSSYFVLPKRAAAFAEQHRKFRL